MNTYTTKISLILVASFAILTAMVNGPSSSGSPAAHTGAPGEKNCATSGCHDDNALNSGNAEIGLDLGGASAYSPKKTYPITISISDPAIKRFGFQVVAISEATGKSIGRFYITDPKKTQLLSNDAQFPDREYVTYTFDGTEAISDGNASWTFQWKAPSKDAGAVKFYVGAVSANDNENDKGDIVYLKNWLINEGK